MQAIDDFDSFQNLQICFLTSINFFFILDLRANETSKFYWFILK